MHGDARQKMAYSMGVWQYPFKFAGFFYLLVSTYVYILLRIRIYVNRGMPPIQIDLKTFGHHGNDVIIMRTEFYLHACYV